ncbi:MAG: hypothetical protein H0U74_17950 [Bradymonadaceae bacterium]|nr:hypothetical protein [Lujinxingiaceae bacterium]
MTRTPSLSLHAAALALVPALLLFSACKSTPTVNPFDSVDQKSTEADLLDEPVVVVSREQSARARQPRPSETAVMMPEAPDDLTRQIDGDPADWDLSKARAFNQKQYVESGAEFWTGAADASFRIAAHSDEGYLYFFVEVTDDQVITRSPQAPMDAVVIWLRDPRLERLLASLPANFRRNEVLRSETAITITPDGKIARFGSGPPLDPSVVIAAASPRANGYNIEIAIKLEVLPQVGAIPLSEIAFRVEVLDGDDEARKGPQTHLSMLPETGDDSPRYALLGVELLPHRPLTGQMPRVDALGAWELVAAGWQFKSLETTSGHWTIMEDLKSTQEAVTDTSALPEACRQQRNDVSLLEAFQSANGQTRVGLFMCGPNPDTGRCPNTARTDLVWVHMVPESGAWSVRRAISVFDEPLAQCVFKGADGEPVHQGFSMFPVSALSPSRWAVGWSSRHHLRDERIEETGVNFVDPQSSSGRVGQVRTARSSSMRERRTVQRSQVFLTQIDDVAGLDICEVETSEDQECTNFDTGCRTHPHGTSVQTLIKTWNPKAIRFESYLQTKHARCTSSTRFEQVDGFMLIHANQRLGLIPTRK